METLSESEIKVMGKRNFFIKITFLFLGIGSLLNWNCVLSNLDFFNFYFTEEAQQKKIILFTPAKIYPFLCNALNLVFQLIIVLTKQKVTFKTQAIFSLVVSTILMILMPIVVTGIIGSGFDDTKLSLYESKIKVAYWVCNLIVFIQGFFTAITTSSIVGLASYFPSEDIVLMSIGQGLSGIVPNIIKYIVLASVGTTSMAAWKKNDVGAWIFFAICAFIAILTCIFLSFAYNTEYFINVLSETGEKKVLKATSIITTGKLIPDERNSDAMETNKQEDGVEKLEMLPIDKLQDKSYSFIELSKKLMDINLLITLVYIVTFLVFPAALTHGLFFNIKSNYLPNTVSFIFNIFDTIGRKSGEWVPPKIRKKTFYIIAFVRLIELVLVPVNISIFPKSETAEMKSVVGPSVFLLVNNALSAVTNGMANSLSYTLAPLQVDPEFQGRAGNCVAFFDIIGIVAGSLLELGTSKLIDKLKR